ncbi:helix-turn-helix domain-containing protein [Ammoniphilus sp. 3BR4]|uniref:helix-turn-helix domain-containing protein n=1 Tax=Ammoniphilus sp. 3BR4 TaxID=3158265 RepID=UPI003465A700
MSLLDNFRLNLNPVYFAYRRTSTETDSFKGIFHFHQGLELTYVHNGSGTVVIEQETYEMNPGTLYIFQPYKLHQLSVNITEEHPFIRSILLFEPSIFENYLERFPSLHLFLQDILNNEIPFKTLAIDEQEINSLWKYEHRIQDYSQNLISIEEHALFIIGYLRCLQNVVNHNSQRPTTQLRKTHRAEQIMQWIDQNYTKEFRLENIAKDLHLSPYHISHLFKEATGSTVSDYLSVRRIQQACLLLATSEKPISQISEEIGLINTSYFCQLFKKHMGSSPYQYRLQLKKRK